MNLPLPGLTVSIFNETELSYTDTSGSKVDIRDKQRVVSNYQYEVELNDNNRQISILRPEYLGVFIGDMKNIMSYAQSSETIDNKTKRVYNSKITGV